MTFITSPYQELRNPFENAASGLNSLPNELLLQIIVTLPTRAILPLAATSHRYHNLILRTLHHRLLAATSLAGRTLILECYHPAVRLTEPEIYCEYLCTPRLSTNEPLAEAPPGQQLHNFNNLFSVFRPHQQDADERAPPQRHPAGDVPGSRTHPSSQPSRGTEQVEEPRVKQLIHLDPGELFTQLAATTMLVEPGRKSRWYLSSAVVSEGVIRLFRPWLAEQAGKQSIFSREESIDWKDDQRGTVWVNDGKNVGVRFNVREHRWRRENPILVHSDEEVAVSYEVQFEEVYVRTRHLLTVIEQSLVGQQGVSSNAIIVGPKVS